MTSQSIFPSPIVILAATDETPEAEDVLRTSATLTQTLNGAELHLLHVVAPLPDPEGVGAFAGGMRDLFDVARRSMDRAVERAREYFSGPIRVHLAGGNVADEILKLASELSADLIVVSPHRKNVAERWLLGSVAEHVARNASCAVLIARPKDYGPAAPEVLPPCADCVAIQNRTQGEKRWCERHTHEHWNPGEHTHYEVPASFGLGSMLIRPEGQ